MTVADLTAVHQEPRRHAMTPDMLWAVAERIRQTAHQKLQQPPTSMVVPSSFCLVALSQQLWRATCLSNCNPVTGPWPGMVDPPVDLAVVVLSKPLLWNDDNKKKSSKAQLVLQSGIVDLQGMDAHLCERNALAARSMHFTKFDAALRRHHQPASRSILLHKKRRQNLSRCATTLGAIDQFSSSSWYKGPNTYY